MDALPDELLCAVFAHSPCLVLRTIVPSVCRRWRNVAGDAVALGKRAACVDTAQPMKRSSRWCDAAAAAGHLDCLTYARYTLGLSWGAATCQAAAREGHVNCLVFAHRNGCPWNRDTTRVAAANGHLGCFLYARKHGCQMHDACALAAACNGHAAILDAIISVDGDQILDVEMCHKAAIAGHLQLVRRICASGVVPSAFTLHYAVRAGNTAVVRYFVEEHDMRARWLLDGAIQSGSLETVRFLCESFGLGSPGDVYTAACERRRKIVIYLLGRVTTIAAGFAAVDGLTVEKIIRHGWVDAVRLLCAPGQHAANFVAASSVDLDRIRCLECALDCGAALDPDLMVRAACRGRIAIINLLVRRGIAWTVDAMHAAARGGHVEALSRAKSAGIPFDVDACALAAKHGHGETVRYICNQKCPVDARARSSAKVYGHHAIERYLTDRGCPWDEDEYRWLVALLRASRTFVTNDAHTLF